MVLHTDGHLGHLFFLSSAIQVLTGGNYHGILAYSYNPEYHSLAGVITGGE